MTQLSSGPEWWQLFPRWADHQMMLNVTDDDLSLLHEQERNLRDVTDGRVENWSKAFFMPTKADRYVGAFRQWLSRHGGNGVAYVNGASDASFPRSSPTGKISSTATTPIRSNAFAAAGQWRDSRGRKRHSTSWPSWPPVRERLCPWHSSGTLQWQLALWRRWLRGN